MAMKNPSIELKLTVYSARNRGHAIHTLRAASTANAAGVFQRSDAIEARRCAAEQLFADLDGLRADGLRERRKVGFPGVLGEGVGPVTAEHQTLRAEKRHGVADVRARFAESRETA